MILPRVRLIVIFLFIWMLAIVLPHLSFAPGNWALLQAERTCKDATLGMQLLVALTGICLIVSMGLLGAMVVRFIWRRRSKKQEDDFILYRENPPVTWRVYAVIALLISAFGGVLWLTWRHADVLDDLVGAQRSAQTVQVQGQRPPPPKISAPETERPEVRTVSFPRWNIPLILISFIVLGLILRRIFKAKPSKERPASPQVIQVVANTVKALEEGGDLSDIVLRCYRDMCKILSPKVAMSRDLTAREFTKLLTQTGIDDEGVTRLTDLFERVRYGHYRTGQNEEAEALASLRTIEEKYGRSSNET